MIESDLILEILESTIEGEKYELQLKEQLNHLNEVEYEHTGSGLIIYFEALKGIKPYKLNDSQIFETFGDSTTELSKFELLNTNLKIHADTTVHFSNGQFDCIEIWNQLGNYPEEDLLTWELKRKEI